MTDRSATGDRPSFPAEIAAGEVVLTLSPDQLYVEFADGVTPQDIDAVLGRYRLEPVPQAAGWVPPRQPSGDFPRLRWLRSATGDDLAGIVGELRATDQVRSASPVYQRADLLPLVTGHGFADDLLVRFAPTASDQEIRSLITAAETTVIATFPDEREGALYHLRLGPSQQDPFAVVDRFARSPLVRDAGPNWIQLQSPASATTPNDPLFAQQWNLSKIEAPAGWVISRGSAGVIIAIMDSGCELTHPDLVNQYVPMPDRFDAISRTNTPDDPVGHGTLCAGVAAAQTDNGLGIAGVAPNCLIMPIRVWSSSGMTEPDIIAAIDWARTHGADVVSMSWYYTAPHQNADIAINNAYAADLVLVAAAGNCLLNEGCVNAVGIMWPATHRHVIAVGATTANDTRKSQADPHPNPQDPIWDSRYGPELSVMAPGDIPWTTSKGGRYGNFYGTSAAAPHVAGLAALILSVIESSTSLPPQAPQFATRHDLVRYIIETTAMQVGGYIYGYDAVHPNGTWNQEMGYGRIDVARALTYARDNYTDYRFRRVSRDYAQAVQILVGLISGGPGVVLPPGGPPVPVDPGWLRLAPETRDVLLGLAITALADGISDPAARQAVSRAAWATIEQTAQRMVQDA